VPIHFICPHCGKATDVDERLNGQSGPCAHCGKPITIRIPGGTIDHPSPDTIKFIVLAAITLGVALLVTVVFGTFIWPAQVADRETARRAQCAAHLQQIATALRQYEAFNGCFPPAYIPDQHGRPMHSWRVLLLPYLGLQDLADRYNFNEPWDSPGNSAVTNVALKLFQCPSQPATNEPLTNYMMVIGPHTISQGSESRKIIDITDGLSNTILLVEVADSDVRWAEPDDLHFDQIDFTINGPKQRGIRKISSYHPQGANAAFCDATVRLLKKSTPPEHVKAMLTIDAGDPEPAKP
jgi:hypothetical protein